MRKKLNKFTIKNIKLYIYFKINWRNENEEYKMKVFYTFHFLWN